MKYIAIIDEQMLSNFRIDDPLIMVVTDKLGFTRGIQLKPLKKLWKAIKSGKGIPRIAGTNIPLQKSVPPMPEKNKEYKEKCSWVSVKDRLPEVNKEVLVYLFPNNQPYIAWWNGTHWQTDEFCLDDYLDEEYEPLAWFPLPEPFKGDN